MWIVFSLVDIYLHICLHYIYILYIQHAGMIFYRKLHYCQSFYKPIFKIISSTLIGMSDLMNMSYYQIVVYYESITVTSLQDESLTIYCTIGGFDTNPPYIEYVWLRHNEVIASSSHTYSSVRNNDMIINNKYEVHVSGIGKTRLRIHPICKYRFNDN